MGYFEEPNKDELIRMLQKQWNDGFNAGMGLCLDAIRAVLETGNCTSDQAVILNGVMAGIKLGLEKDGR